MPNRQISYNPAKDELSILGGRNHMFRDIDFGWADANREIREHPELLVEGFYDLDNASLQLKAQKSFLIGRKGAGKSALFQHLHATAPPQETISIVRLGQFPFSDFMSIDTGESSTWSRLSTAWNVLLLITLIRSLKKDLSSSCLVNDPG